MAVADIPSVVTETQSNNPVVGFTNNPAMPFSVPLRHPLVPSFLAPLYGLQKTPVIPDSKPFPIALAPWPKP